MKILDNPVYTGKIAYGKNVTEKVKGTRDEYRRVKTDDYLLADGLHEAIVDEETWEAAREKRKRTGVRWNKTHSKLLVMLDALDASDKHYARKFQDMQDRLDNLYDRISGFENEIADVEEKIKAAYGRQISEKQLYQILQKFDILYAEMSDIEKKEFMQLFIDAIELYSEKMDDGRIIRQIDLAFPVYYEGFEGEAIRLLNENTVETVVLLSKLK